MGYDVLIFDYYCPLNRVQ